MDLVVDHVHAVCRPIGVSQSKFIFRLRQHDEVDVGLVSGQILAVVTIGDDVVIEAVAIQVAAISGECLAYGLLAIAMLLDT